MRDNIRPVFRQWPKWALLCVAVVQVPLAVGLGAWGGIKEGWRESVRLLDELRLLAQLATAVEQLQRERDEAAEAQLTALSSLPAPQAQETPHD